MSASEQKVRSDVEEFGWHVVTVGAQSGPDFGFTIGLHQTFGHPEVLMIGLPDHMLRNVLNVVGENVKSGARYSAGASYSGILEGHQCAFRSVPGDRFPEYLGYAIRFYAGVGFPCIQCIWPDRLGRFPWRPEASNADRAAQPVLSVS